ncbi:hypothetical protein FACS1894211_09720 [Clostridia bacterium]|nr:hypothetical protein FACS1894211_09720 [Clostridia bacterium]
MIKEYEYYGIEEANGALKELGLRMVGTRDGHWWIPGDPNAETIKIIPLWEDTGKTVRASFGVSVVAAVLETVEEAYSFTSLLMRYARVLEKLLSLEVYGVLIGARP